MRAAFAPELLQHPAPESLIRNVAKPRHDEPTGLAAFDEIDPVSTVSAASAVQVAPADELADSTVTPIPDRTHAREPGREPGTGVDFDWDDEQLVTGTTRTEEGHGLAAAGDNDVTRQLFVGDMFSGPVGGGSAPHDAGAVLGAPSPFGPPAAVSSTRTREDPSQRTVSGSVRPPAEPTLPPSANTSYGVIMGIVVAIVALIASALFVTRPIQTARLQVNTLPVDAEVRVDGRRVAMRTSPFVVQNLAPRVEHRIDVSKPGFRPWTTKLSFTAGQVMQLPRVELAAEPSAAEEAPAAPEPEALADDATPSATAPALGARAAGPGAPSVPDKRAGAPRAPVRQAEPSPNSETAQSRTATGVLRINSMPWSRVSVDGRSVGSTPQTNLQLPAGTHSVSLVNPPFKLSKTIKVKIVAGETLTKTVDLQ
jgi:hypothetical protein